MTAIGGGLNGLMDFDIPEQEPGDQQGVSKSSIILACYSDRYFNTKLSNANSHSLLTTNGLMAPEAYILEAAIAIPFKIKVGIDEIFTILIINN